MQVVNGMETFMADDGRIYKRPCEIEQGMSVGIVGRGNKIDLVGTVIRITVTGGEVWAMVNVGRATIPRKLTELAVPI